MTLEQWVAATAQEVKGQDLQVECPHSELECDICAPAVQLLCTKGQHT